jgi:Ca2+-binding RTX toxin-like protein
LVVDDQGRILVIGKGTNNDYETYSFLAMARLMPDGTLDDSFGSGGLDSPGIDFLGVKGFVRDGSDYVIAVDTGIVRIDADGSVYGGLDEVAGDIGGMARVGPNQFLLINKDFELVPYESPAEIDLPNFTLNNGVLTFNGTAGDDQVSLWTDGSHLVVWSGGDQRYVRLSAISRIELNGAGGNDLLKLNPGLALPAILNGGDGNDKLVGGAGNDTLFGGLGDDHLTGNGGDDLLDGGLGDDVMLGCAGIDTADYSSRTANLLIGLDKWQDDGEAGEFDLAYLDIERVLGGSGNDRIGGGAADNELLGNAGDDTLGGGAGNDSLFGGLGNDKLDGGEGDDYLEGAAGHDVIYGGDGADLLLGLAGNDVLLGDDGAKDTVIGGAGTDSGDTDLLDEVSGIEIVV